MKLKRVLILLAVPVVLLAVWTIYWFRLADEVAAAVDRFAADQQVAGRDFSHGPVVVNGWPFRLEATVPVPVLTAGGTADPARVAAEQVVVFMQPMRPTHLVAVITGPVMLSSAGSGITLTPAHAAASAVFDDQGRLQRSALDMTEVTGRFTPATGRPAGFTMARAQLHQRREAEGGMRGALEIDGMDPEAADLPTLSRLFVDLTRSGPVAEPVTRAALERWRDDGGVVEMTRFEAIADDVTVTGDGTFALDAALRPEGAAAFRIAGAETVLARLEASGDIKPAMRAVLDQMLGLFERVDDEGRTAVRVPLTIQSGVLSVAGLPLVPVEPVLPPETAS